MRHRGSVEALKLRCRHVDRKIAKLELLDVRKSVLGFRKIFGRESRDPVVRGLRFEIAREQSRVDARRTDRDRREETLVTVIAQCPGPKTLCQVAKIIELPIAKVGNTRDEVHSAKLA